MSGGMSAASAASTDGGCEPERLALLALSRIAEPGDERLLPHVTTLGAERVLAGIREGTLDTPALRHYRARLDAVHPRAELAHARRSGIRLLCHGDPEWPSQLDDLGDARPLVLWVRGPLDLRAVSERSVAVVGARASTSYGEHVGAEIGAVVGERGWTVVSGAAYGIDAAAHRGALAVDGPTIAVLACGVDVTYPRGHESLLRRIASAGLVVSELAPGCAVTRGRFLQRNRVIAALTRGTVVVEAAARSGALNTARHAQNLGRFLMAVPGPVTSAQSAGCHRLLREDPDSVLVTDGAEVLDLVGEMGADAAPMLWGPETERDGLAPDESRVLDALPRRTGAPVDALVRTAGLHVATVLRCLAALEARGLAEAHGAGWRVRDPQRRV